MFVKLTNIHNKEFYMRKIITNPTQVKSINKRWVLDIIRKKEPISRASISRITMLSRATISNIVSELIEEGFIIEAYTGDSIKGLGGKKPRLLTLNYENLIYMGIDIYSDLFRISIIDAKGKVVKRIRKLCKLKNNDPSKYFAYLRKEINALLTTRDGKRVRGIGLSVPGNILSEKGIIVNSVHMGWSNVNVFSYLKDIDKPIVMDNRAVSSLIGELWFGKYDLPHDESIFYITIGEGVGGAMIINDRILRGLGMSAGEIGLTVMNVENRKTIFFEDLISDRAIVNTYEALTRKGPLPDESTIEFAKRIIEDAKKKDKDALVILKEKARLLGMGIVNIINLIFPKIIIITGAVTHAWDIISPIIQKTIRNYIHTSFIYENIIIKPSLFQEDATLFGGAALFARYEFNNIS